MGSQRNGMIHRDEAANGSVATAEGVEAAHHDRDQHDDNDRRQQT